VQRAIDARAGMAAVRDLRGYTMYQAANGLRELAASKGGSGAAAGLGAGAGLGMLLPGFLGQAMQAPTPAPSGTARGEAGHAKTPPGLDLDALRASAGNVQQLIRDVARSNHWTLQEGSDAWQLVIPLGPLRKQTVSVRFDRRDQEGYEVIRFSTPCAPVQEENALVYLRYNAQMMHGAFAVEPSPSGEMIVIEANQLADTADPLEITRTVAAIAWQADQIEERLLKEDRL
jgi:hypothetical protein